MVKCTGKLILLSKVLKKITLPLIILTGVFTMSYFLKSNETKNLISHKDKTHILDLSVFEKQLESKADLSLPLTVEKELLRQLSEFEFGRFLLVNKGLNGYWTSYAILRGIKKEKLSPLESWLLNKAPAIKATSERFRIFNSQLQKHLRNGIKIASIPCGLMDDLLCLNYKNLKDIKLAGIDLDQESLELAKENSKDYGIQNAEYIKKDAWNLNINEEYDILTSNGLNIYEQDFNKIIDLYKQFYKALKVGGILITSFLTPPPSLEKNSTWKNYDTEDALKQKAIFSDIIQAKWQTFQTEDQARLQLEKAGFKVLEVIYDSQGMFPTVVARKISQKIA